MKPGLMSENAKRLQQENEELKKKIKELEKELLCRNRKENENDVEKKLIERDKSLIRGVVMP